ncbi:hypothetical protein AB0J86_19925, partial [Micromonospora sp. NPDC049559]|uniref:hypothetical protein n=1 Tax=Micromonospora sp. NPDC049559 TaxID=3155923 RepID=UPI0034297314
LMIASLLGLTWNALRARIIQRGVPEQAMGAVEKTVPVAQKLQSQGVAGVTEEIKEQVGDLKGNLFGKISEYLIPTILVAGITWIVSLLNPASAFIRACKMIIDFVMFIVNQGAQIIEFVNSVLDAIIAIAGGGAGGVPALIEKALARSVPVLIGALAAILGIGGIANKVKSFFQALAKPVNKAINWIVDKIVNLGKKLWAKLKAGGKKLKEKVRAGDDSPAGKQQRLNKALSAAVSMLGRFAGRKVSDRLIKPMLAPIRMRYGLTVLRPIQQNDVWAVHGAINPEETRPSRAQPEEPLTEPLRAAWASLTSDDAKAQFQQLRERARNMVGFERAIAAKIAAGQRANPPKSLDEVLSGERQAKQKPAATLPPELIARIDAAIREVARVEGRVRTYKSAHSSVRGTDRWLSGLQSEREALEREKSTDNAASMEGRLAQHLRAIRGIDSEVELAEISREVVEVAMPVARGKAKSDVDVVTEGGRVWKDAKDYNLFGLNSYNWTSHLRPQALRQLDIAGDPAYSNGGPPQLVYWFRRGVTPEVANALEQMGIRVEGERIPYAADQGRNDQEESG